MFVAGRVFTMNGYYFVMTRRYICYHCKGKHDQKIAAGLLAAKERDEETQYTFTATNPKTVLLEPYGRGMNLQAVLTETSGVDESIVDLMRPLFAAGVKPSRLSRAMLEWHSKTHTREHIKYEHELTRCKHEQLPGIGPQPPPQPVMFSSFTNKGLYAGAVA